MERYSFSIFPNENFMDLRLLQFGWEQCEPLHSFGPHIRNHYLFHYVISGQGILHSQDENGVDRQYRLGPGHGFLICPGQINTYLADEKNPWKYVWLEFDGLRAADLLTNAGLSVEQPIYSSWDLDMSEAVMQLMMHIAEHPEASAPHLIGYLYLFMDALITSSASRRDAENGRLRDFYMQEAVTIQRGQNCILPWQHDSIFENQNAAQNRIIYITLNNIIQNHCRNVTSLLSCARRQRLLQGRM